MKIQEFYANPIAFRNRDKKFDDIFLFFDTGWEAADELIDSIADHMKMANCNANQAIEYVLSCWGFYHVESVELIHPNLTFPEQTAGRPFEIRCKKRYCQNTNSWVDDQPDPMMQATTTVNKNEMRKILKWIWQDHLTPFRNAKVQQPSEDK